MQHKTEQIASHTRLYRKLHRWLAVPLFVFMFLIGATGFLLGWKKNAGLLPPTSKGATADASQWISLDSIRHFAETFARDSLQKSTVIDRMDIRPSKGVAKIVFAGHFTELQIDCATGKILSVSTRTSDILEKIHDGSLLDFFLGTSGDPVKLVYTTILSISLMLLSFSGFWLWWNPKRIRKIKSHDKHLPTSPRKQTRQN